MMDYIISMLSVSVAVLACGFAFQSGKLLSVRLFCRKKRV